MKLNAIGLSLSSPFGAPNPSSSFILIGVQMGVPRRLHAFSFISLNTNECSHSRSPWLQVPLPFVGANKQQREYCQGDMIPRKEGVNEHGTDSGILLWLHDSKKIRLKKQQRVVLEPVEYCYGYMIPPGRIQAHWLDPGTPTRSGGEF